MSVNRNPVFKILVPILIFGFTGGGAGAFPVQQESSNPYLIDRDWNAGTPVPPFEADSEQILRFYPPVSADAGKALRVFTSSRERRKITLLTADDAREILLPQTQTPIPLHFYLPSDLLLTGIILPKDIPVEIQPIWLDSRRGAASVPEIYLDNPEVLYYSPSVRGPVGRMSFIVSI